MFALSSAQAAATLAAILVGVDIGLIGTRTLNAVVAVIAVTCVLSSWLGNRSARQLPHPPPKTEVGGTVVVPVARPASARPLVRLAAATIARPASGFVVPVIVISPQAAEERFEEAVAMKAEAEAMALSYGVEAESVLRVDSTPAEGIHHTIVERRASLMVVGWKGSSSRREALFGGILDQIVADVGIPTIIGRIDGGPFERIVVGVPMTSTMPAARGSLVLAVETARRLRAEEPRPLEVVVERQNEELRTLATETLAGSYHHDGNDVVTALRERTRPSDLVILPVSPGRRRVPLLAVRIARQLTDNPLLIVLDGSAQRVGDGPEVQVRGAPSLAP